MKYHVRHACRDWSSICTLWLLPFVLVLSYFTFTSVNSQYIAAVFALNSYLLKWLKIREETSFICIRIVYLFLWIFIHVDPRFCQVSNSFCLNNYFNFSCNTALLVIIFCSFCLFEKGLYFSFIFESFFSGCRFQGIFFLSAR